MNEKMDKQKKTEADKREFMQSEGGQNGAVCFEQQDEAEKGGVDQRNLQVLLK